MEIIKDSQYQHSILDILDRIMPSLKNLSLRLKPDKDPNTKYLMDIWSQESYKVANNKFRIPESLNNEIIKRLESSGMIEQQGRLLKITEKGSSVIKYMILNDNSSAFDSPHVKKASISKNNWYYKLNDTTSK